MILFTKCKNSLRLFLAISLYFIFPAPAFSQAFKLAESRKRETIEFKFIKNLIIIPLEINGKGPFNFILDSGVGLFIITDPTLTDSLSIKNMRSITISGLGEGNNLSAYISPSIRVKIGENISGSCATAILKTDQFNLSEYAGVPIHGLIGYEFFNSFIVRINYQAKSVTVYDPKTSYIPRKGARIPIRIDNNKPYLTATVNLTPAKSMSANLIIDTGAGHPLSLESDNNMPIEIPPVSIPANLGVGLTGPINGYLGRLTSIKLGRYELKNIISAFPNYQDVGNKVNSVNRNGNMGNNILKRFNLVFDYGREFLYIKPNAVFREPFEHDMSGMELIASGADYTRVLIARVEPGSAATDAGLERDDEILSINFKPTKEMSLEEIDELFRSRNDRSFILDVLHHGSKEKTHVILTLKRRI